MSNTAQQQIVDDGAPRKYFHIMLNMADDDLDPYEYRLLGHYIRVGQCWESVRTTAEKTRMSVGKVHSTRKALAEKGYISLREHESGTTLVTIIDRWAENVARYAPKIVPDHDDVHTVNIDVHEVNIDVHEVKQRRTIEEEPTKKDSAPDGAPDAVEDSTESLDETPDKSELDELFEALAAGSFGITDMSLVGKLGGRIGKLRKWLVENFPDHRGIHVKAFYAWWGSQYGDAAAPRDPGKFAEHYLKFVQLRRNGKSPGKSPREYVPKHVDVYVPPADVVNPVRQKETAA